MGLGPAHVLQSRLGRRVLKSIKFAHEKNAAATLRRILVYILWCLSTNSQVVNVQRQHCSLQLGKSRGTLDVFPSDIRKTAVDRDPPPVVSPLALKNSTQQYTSHSKIKHRGESSSLIYGLPGMRLRYFLRCSPGCSVVLLVYLVCFTIEPD